MEIKQIDEQYLPQLRNLASYCFRVPEEDLDWYEKNKFDSKNSIGLFINDNLVSSVSVLPLKMFFQQTVVKMGGIAMVSTLPEYRGQNCIQKLMKKALEIMKNREQIVSLLDPFSHRFYRNYGWSQALENKIYNFPLKKLPSFDVQGGRLRPLRRDDLNEVQDLYRKFASNYNGTINRTDKKWQMIFDLQDRKNKYRYCYQNVSGQIEGYIFYNLTDEEIEIEEMCYSTVEVKKYILNFIYRHRAQVDNLSWRAPVDDTTPLLLPEPGVECKLQKGMMFRVVDVKKTLEIYLQKCSNLVSVDSFTIKINDSWASWNNKIFRVVKKPEICVKEETQVAPELKMNIVTFSQLLFGQFTLEQLQKADKIEGESYLLDQLKPVFAGRAGHIFSNDKF